MFAATLATLAACGQDSPANTPHVAAAPAASSAAPTTSSAAATGETGIQQRLDDSPRKVEEIIKAYDNCLHDAGAIGTWIPQLNYWKIDYEDQAKVTPAQLKACESKRLLPPTELDPKKNPHYAEDTRADAQCIRDHGVQMTGDNPLTSFVVEPSPEKYKIVNDCLVQAFSQH
jgi:predicted small lipoprotein YifL